MKITQPIAYFDLESSGVSVVKDRICSIAVNVIKPDGSRSKNYKTINPTIPIPEAASLIHGLYDKDVADSPQFVQIAKSLYSLLDGCVIIGYNSNDFDVVMLSEEFARAGIVWPKPDQLFIDCYNIFRKKEERTLKAAVKFYCGEEMVDAHNSAVDIEYTEKVLNGQLEMYPDLKDMSLEELAEYSRYGDLKRVDLAGKFVQNAEGDILFSFGKHKDKKAIDAFKEDKYYYKWLCGAEFTSETLRIAKEIYDFVYPPKN